ncbi:Flp family type IVb pilin [Terasakiella pusilla]|uniref:Flp family type IVb pilin n=1 Tax=Terasakiella pusilla TaxID=64973 RepID=UPI003AA9AC78
MRTSLNALWMNEEGVTAIEYGILAASMAAAIGLIFGSDGAFVSALNERFANIADQITTTNK